MMCQAAISLWIPLFGELVLSIIGAITLFEHYMDMMAKLEGKQGESGAIAASSRAELNAYKVGLYLDLVNRPYQRHGDAALSALGDKLLKRIPRLKIALTVLLLAIVAIDLGLC